MLPATSWVAEPLSELFKPYQSSQTQVLSYNWLVSEAGKGLFEQVGQHLFGEMAVKFPQ